jgi:preprotein translocase SecE subunit
LYEGEVTVVAEKSAKPKRRMVKKAETVREKTEQSAQNAQPQEKKRGVLWLTLRYISAPFRWLGRRLKPLGRFKLFRVLGKIFWPTYFRNSWKELRQVTWPGRKESWQLTLAVIIFAIIFGAIIAAVDYGLDKLFKQVLLK